MKYLLFWCAVISTIAYSNKEARSEPNSPNETLRKSSTSQSKALFHSQQPLILQYEVSHSRNRDQISLIFRENKVELVTNTSSYQERKNVKLGRFQSPLTAKLKTLKKQIAQYYVQMQKTMPLSALIKDPRFQSEFNPHAPILRINEEEINNNHPYFDSLFSIIYKIWEQKWICVECATYKKGKNKILRISKRSISNLNNKSSAAKTKGSKKIKDSQKIEKKTFSKKQLNCYPKENDKVECVDLQFGIFEI